MTLKEMKEKTYRLIEELSEDTAKQLTDDPDYEKKVNTCISIIQNELARLKKISAKLEYDLETGLEYTMPDDMYQVAKVVGSRYTQIGKWIIFEPNEKNSVTIYYYKYPKEITEETNDDEYKFELTQDCLEIMPFGIAGDMLKTDVSTNYGAYFSNRYNELKQGLDPRLNAGSMYIDTEAIYEWDWTGKENL